MPPGMPVSAIAPDAAQSSTAHLPCMSHYRLVQNCLRTPDRGYLNQIQRLVISRDLARS